MIASEDPFVRHFDRVPQLVRREASPRIGRGCEPAWALRQSDVEPFEVEFYPVEGSTPWGKDWRQPRLPFDPSGSGSLAESASSATEQQTGRRSCKCLRSFPRRTLALFALAARGFSCWRRSGDGANVACVGLPP